MSTYRPVNMMERVVELKLLELMKKSDVCCCEKCCADVRAIALNSLPPKYVVTREGEAMTEFDLMTSQMQAVVVSELLIAVEKVRRNPRHNCDHLALISE
jgi:competence protein ComFB